MSYFLTIEKTIESLLEKGVKKGVFSGAAVGLYKNHKGKGNKKIICCGKTKNEKGGREIKANTLFDLASLTKPLCTLLGMLNLMEMNIISWDDDINALLGTKKAEFSKKIKIEHLLSHSSGLRSYAPFYKNFKPILNKANKRKLINTVLKEKPEYPPGEKCIYSDLGYMLLGEIIEKASGKRLDEYFASAISRPLSLEKQLMFRPLDATKQSETGNIAATQNCPWRKRLLQGEVDDEHCWLMNGVAGHAGLFGSVKGVLDINVHILNQLQGRKQVFTFGPLLQRALTRRYAGQSWRLGFDTPTQPGSSAGEYISAQSVGHLGFTGTSFWIDPDKDMVVAVLTNRVYPTRENNRIKEFRRQLHDTIFRFVREKENSSV